MKSTIRCLQLKGLNAKDMSAVVLARDTLSITQVCDFTTTNTKTVPIRGKYKARIALYVVKRQRECHSAESFSVTVKVMQLQTYSKVGKHCLIANEIASLRYCKCAIFHEQ